MITQVSIHLPPTPPRTIPATMGPGAQTAPDNCPDWPRSITLREVKSRGQPLSRKPKVLLKPLTPTGTHVSLRREHGVHVCLYVYSIKKPPVGIWQNFSRREETQAAHSLSMFLMETSSMNLISEPKRLKVD